MSDNAIVSKSKEMLMRHGLNKSAVIFCAVVLSTVVLVLFRNLLFLYPTGDVLIWLHRYQFEFHKIFGERTNEYHYCPLALVWVGLPLSLFGFEPFWINLNFLIIHIANTCLVFFLASLFLDRISHAFFATVLFCAGLFVPETIVANPTSSTVTTLLLLCFFLYRSYMTRDSIILLILANLVFVSAVFVFPTAINFFMLLFFYWVFDPEEICRKGKQWRFTRDCPAMLRLLLPPLFIVFVFLAVRSQFTVGITRNQIYLLDPATLKGFLLRTLNAFDTVLVPSQFIRALIPKNFISTRAMYMAWSALFILVIFLISFLRPSARDRFFACWLITNIVLVSFETDARCCHLYFPAIAASIFLVQVLNKTTHGFLDLATRTCRRYLRCSRTFTNGFIGSILTVCILTIPIKNNLANVRYFMGTYIRASQIVRASIQYVKSTHPLPIDGERIYLINMPVALTRSGSITSFLFPYRSLLQMLDLEDGARIWTKNASSGTCEDLYTASKTEWHFFNELTDPNPHSRIHNYSIPELLRLVAQPKTAVFLFDYALEKPVMLRPGRPIENSATSMNGQSLPEKVQHL